MRPRDGRSTRPATRPHGVLVDAISRRFRTSTTEVVALERVSVDAPGGEFTAVVGPSGSGKSTLLAIVACADRADAGRVVLGGVDVSVLGRRARRAMRRMRLGIVLPQPSDNLLDDFDVAGNLRWAAGRRGAACDVASALGAVGLDRTHAAKRVSDLSGGEQQRLALACALVGDPDVIAADEPTASLDRESADGVIGALRAAAQRGAALLVATHDPHVVAAADVVISLDHGRRVS